MGHFHGIRRFHLRLGRSARLNITAFHLPFTLGPFFRLLFDKGPPSLHYHINGIGGALHLRTGRGPSALRCTSVLPGTGFLRGGVGTLAGEPSVRELVGILLGQPTFRGLASSLLRQSPLRGRPGGLAFRGGDLARFGRWGLFSGGGVLPPFLRHPFLPLTLEQLSPLPYRRFGAGHHHIRRIVDKIISGKLYLVLGVLAGGGLTIIHQRRRVLLRADKGIFHPLAHNDGLVQYLNVLACGLFTGLDPAHSRSPPVFLSSGVSILPGPHSSSCGAGLSTPFHRLYHQRQSQRPGATPRFPLPGYR